MYFVDCAYIHNRSFGVDTGLVGDLDCYLHLEGRGIDVRQTWETSITIFRGNF
jgi:hypothetical protein